MLTQYNQSFQPNCCFSLFQIKLRQMLIWVCGGWRTGIQFLPVSMIFNLHIFNLHLT